MTTLRTLAVAVSCAIAALVCSLPGLAQVQAQTVSAESMLVEQVKLQVTQPNPYMLTATQSNELRQSTSLAQQQQMAAIARRIVAGESATSINELWSHLLICVYAPERDDRCESDDLGVTRRSAVDAQTLAMNVMMMSYGDAQNELKAQAQKVQALNDKKSQLIAELMRLRDELDQVRFALPRARSEQETIELRDREKFLLARIAELENQLARQGEMTQLAFHDLQTLQNKYSQAIQTFTALMKMFHDTASAILRNLR